MNPLEQPDQDDKRAEQLAAYDDALAAGGPSAVEAPPPADLPPEQREDFAYLQWLRQALPPATATPPTDAEATSAHVPVAESQRDASPEPTLPNENVGRISNPSHVNPPDVPPGLLDPPRGEGEMGWLGEYRILRPLGVGGMGIVFVAEDSRLKRPVALKVMKPAQASSPDAGKMFLREAQAAAALRHERVVTIYNVGEAGGILYLAMELLRGESLEDRLKREARLSIAAIVRIGRETAEGLAAAHDQGLMHRDIKPANIWLERKDERGRMKDEKARQLPAGSSFILHPSSFRVKILDFGLARPEEGDARLTQTGVAVGTPHYMAPEQAAGEKVDHRCDLFGLGCVLYRLATGNTPFQGANVRAVLKSVMFDNPQPPRELAPDLPLPLADLIVRLLAKEPGDRPQSAAEVVDALSAIESELTSVRDRTVPTTPITDRSRPEPPTPTRPAQLTMIAGARRAGKGRRRLFAAGIGLVVIGVGALWLGPAIYDHFKPVPDSIPPEVKTPVAASEPFVILAKDGRPEQAVATLADAVAAAQSDDVIEIHSDGPFVVRPIDLKKTALTLRAGPGAWPVLRLTADAEQANMTLLKTQAPLVLEGLEFRREGNAKPAVGLTHISSRDAPLAVSHCRFVLRNKGNVLIHALAAERSDPLQIRDCEFLGDWHAGVALNSMAANRMVVASCLFLSAHNAVNVQIPRDAVLTTPASLQLLDNTMIVGHHGVNIQAGADKPPAVPSTKLQLRIKARRNVCTQGLTSFHFFSISKQADEYVDRQYRAWAPQLVALADDGNRIAAGARLVSFQLFTSSGQSRPKEPITKPEQWRTLWKLDKLGTTFGALRFQRKDLAPNTAAPEALTPQDFRLQDPTAKVLGADVDLVGPGPAYEKWKRTDGHKQWLKDISQASALKPFVILAKGGRPEKAVATLEGAVAAAQSGDTIEVHADGPPITRPIKISGKALTIRAAPGAAPTLLLKRNAASDPTVNIETDSSLTLEGFNFHAADPVAQGPPYQLMFSNGAPLRVANCRFLLNVARQNDGFSLAGSPRCEIRNCQLTHGAPGGIFASWRYPSNGQMVLDNNLIVGGSAAFLTFRAGNKNATLKLMRNSMLAGTTLIQEKGSPSPAIDDKAGSVRIDAQENVFAGDGALGFGLSEDAIHTGTEAEALLKRLLDWRENRNAHGEGFFLWMGRGDKGILPTKELKEVKGWEDFWGIGNTGSLQGAVKFEGGDLIKKANDSPAALKPEDFRLASDSIGKGKGKDGKDLGADVDLVGPGRAYEKWKQTKEYQEWLKGTGPVSAPKPFVILAKGGRPEKAVATLQGAVAAAQSGDIIEVIADGPAITKPIYIGKKALTIRAAPGTAPTLLLKREANADPTVNIWADSPLTLEGLAFHFTAQAPPVEGFSWMLRSDHAPFRVANCKFLADLPGSYCFLLVHGSQRCEIRNCQAMLTRSSASLFNWHYGSKGQLILDNNAIAGLGHAVVFSPNGNAKNAGFQLVRNSMAISSMALTLNEETPAIDKTDHSLRIDVRENVLCRGISFGQNQNKPADTGAEAGALLKRLVAWHEQRNAYSSNATLLLLAKRDQLIDITWDRTKLAEWNAFWGIDNTGSVQGTLAFQGGDLQKKAQESPAALVPADFRLTKASIGKGKRSDGKDLGADLDLVGPGPAYEKWKQTKGYEQWLRDTGSKR
jgi:serine/threonine protein kinase/TusA-related sulfurtransferase